MIHLNTIFSFTLDIIFSTRIFTGFINALIRAETEHIV